MKHLSIFILYTSAIAQSGQTPDLAINPSRAITSAKSPSIENTAEPTATITDLLVNQEASAPHVFGFAQASTSQGCHVVKVEGIKNIFMFARHNGVAGKHYDRITRLFFSKTGSSLIYCAESTGKKRVVYNNKEDPPVAIIHEATLVMSDDGSRYAYIASDGIKTFAVIDGKKQSRDLNAAILPPVFSPNGSHVAFVETDFIKQGMRVVNNDKTGVLYAGIGEDTIVFNDDGTHCSYNAFLNETQSCRIIDDIAQPPYDGIGVDFVFDKDGKRHAYMARSGMNRVLIVDGKQMHKIDAILDHSLIFSPDGKRLAAQLKLPNGNSAILIDNQLGPEFTATRQTAPKNTNPYTSSTFISSKYGTSHPISAFSPDSKKFAYTASIGAKKQTVIMVDHQPASPPFDMLAMGLIFSPDSNRLAYGGKNGGKAFVSIDGINDQEYDEIGLFMFSKDSQHYTYVAREGNSHHIIIDGKKFATYNNIPAGPVFRDDGKIEALVTDNNSLFKIEIPTASITHKINPRSINSSQSQQAHSKSTNHCTLYQALLCDS